jgi:pimeloyl-ACP methyl ester carboxylesterase
MMRRLFALALVTSLGACKLDGFMFDPTKVSAYTLSTKVIPDSLQKFVTFRSDDETLTGVLARQPGSAPRRTILYSHGNDAQIGEFWERVEWLWQAGFDVFIYDYRGYGMSTGKSESEETVLTDGHAALAAVLALPGVTPASLVLYGYSLGCVPTIELASGAVRPRAVITESAFTSTETLAHSGTILDIPGGYLMKGTFDNLGRAPRVTAPWLILHGLDDGYVDASSANRLYAAAGGVKQLVLVPGAGHGDVEAKYGTAAYEALIRSFVAAQAPN